MEWYANDGCINGLDDDIIDDTEFISISPANNSTITKAIKKLVTRSKGRNKSVRLALDVKSGESTTEKCIFEIEHAKASNSVTVKYKDRIICMDVPNSTYGDYNMISIDKCILDFLHIKLNL